MTMLSENDWGQPPTLTAWIYDSPMGAAAGQVRLTDLVLRGAVTVQDAVTATWVPGSHRPRVGHLRHETTRRATLVSNLGAMVDLLTTEAATDHVQALADGLRGTGIDATFLKGVKSALQPGSSALLVLSSGADLDQVRPVIERGFARGDVYLIHAHLRPQADAALGEAVRSMTSHSP